jgi:hypothetical protein
MNNHRRKLLVNSLKASLGLAIASVLGPAVLSSCKKKQQPNTDAKITSQEACPSADKLSQDEKNIRNSLKYVDISADKSKNCKNCKLYTLPQNNSPCGGCKVIPGPVHPDGYCTAWMPRM